MRAAALQLAMVALSLSAGVSTAVAQASVAPADASIAEPDASRTPLPEEADPADVDVDVDVDTGDADPLSEEAGEGVHEDEDVHVHEDEDEDGDDVAGGRDPGEDVVESLGAAIGQIGESLGRPQEPHSRIRWDPEWPRYRFDELVVTAGMGLVILLEELLPTRTDANWTSVTDLDVETARVLGLRSAQNREIIEGISDGMVAALFAWPVIIDSLLYTGLGEGAWDVAWQLSLISLEVFAVNHALTVLVRLLTRRERPLQRFCREDPAYAERSCEDQPAADGFWSEHTSNAFAGAALVCMHHDVLDLFGNEAADMTACATAVAAAAATGLFRIMSDYHWVTDVMTGAVIGSLSGILLPWLLHFQGGARPPLEGSDPPPMTFLPLMGPGEIGISAQGVW